MIAATPLDYPNIRAQCICPLCQQAKDKGALTCWACYGRFQLRYGLSCSMENNLMGREAYLARIKGRSIHLSPEQEAAINSGVF